MASLWPLRRSSLPNLTTIPLPRILREYRAAAASRPWCNQSPSPAQTGAAASFAAAAPRRLSTPARSAETLAALQRSRASPPPPPPPPPPPRCGSSGYGAPIPVSPRARTHGTDGRRDPAPPLACAPFEAVAGGEARDAQPPLGAQVGAPPALPRTDGTEGRRLPRRLARHSGLCRATRPPPCEANEAGVIWSGQTKLHHQCPDTPTNTGHGKRKYQKRDTLKPILPQKSANCGRQLASFRRGRVGDTKDEW